MKKASLFFYFSALLIFLLDQIAKRLVVWQMFPNQSIPLIKNILHLTYVQNTGAAFGILKGSNVFLLGAGIVVLAVVFFFHLKLSPADQLYQIVLGFIFGGSIGNLLDRLTRGFVVDFIDFRFWPVFNFADTFINIGIFILILMLLFRKDKKNVSYTA
ncbi:MAG: signal peptidase II [Candidatus Margulisbacteria bacterium]|nr:signal peptidase II [Candidatus Margulisiibacteriota bacterium]MBU1021263.1 signal peptidase II [Candidatus Margulisiibacteriota bacterium]MBU1729248.1 signal peptidase II [Candidatus Margulisiibacteriota bacterium]MBU1954921.1 signal peptidase II [Candidatus Margulisiibacteriota bacterium]